MAITTALDHLVYVVPDLDAGVARFAEATGVQPVYGGAHVGLGTANYLVGLHPAGWADEPTRSHTSRSWGPIRSRRSARMSSARWR